MIRSIESNVGVGIRIRRVGTFVCGILLYKSSKMKCRKEERKKERKIEKEEKERRKKEKINTIGNGYQLM